jgi:hypothetical protein
MDRSMDMDVGMDLGIKMEMDKKINCFVTSKLGF